MTRPNFEELDRLHGPNPGFFMARALREYPSISAYVRNLEERERKLTAALEQAKQCANDFRFYEDDVAREEWPRERLDDLDKTVRELLGEGRTG